MNHTSKTELLAPAGNMDIFYSVMEAGADAVYLGGDLFGARAYATNFSTEEIIKAIQYAHLFQRKVYLTINTLLKNPEIKEQLFHYLLPFYVEGLDAVIVQDLGVAAFIKEHFPLLDLHASTQLSVTSAYGAQFLKDCGFTRIVPAREISLNEIEAIKENCDIEIESFIHGAMCYCYSGQCLFSSLLGGRSGNRGRCTQPCRLPYDLLDRQKNLVAQEKYLLSMNDMNTLPILEHLLKSGICSFKIEGRMKQKEYAQGVVRIYRQYMDQYLNSDTPPTLTDIERGVDQLKACGSRSGSSTGYYKQYNGSSMITMNQASYSSDSGNISFMREITPLDIPIKGMLHAVIGEPLQFQIRTDSNEYPICIHGPIVEPAQNAPATKEQLISKITQINDTVFRFTDLDIQLDSNAFVPMSLLKQLRRDAIQELQLQMLSQTKRKMNAPAVKEPDDVQYSCKYQHTFFVSTLQQLNVIFVQAQPSQIIISFDLWKHHKSQLAEQIQKHAQFSFYLDLPWVFREGTIHQLKDSSFIRDLNLFDGVQVNSLDGLQFALKLVDHNLKIICGPSIYQMNDWSVHLLPTKIASTTLSYELNKKELWGLHNKQAILTIYGYLPLMISTQCVFKTLGHCKHKNQAGFLKDRYDKLFYVESSCDQCNNIIYNSEPLCLLQHYETLIEHGFHNFRFDFHMEEPSQVEEVLFLLEQCQKETKIKASDIPFSYTNGHFKRGVE